MVRYADREGFLTREFVVSEGRDGKVGDRAYTSVAPPHLLERDAVLAAIDRTLRRAAGGSGATLFVIGQAGLGKTTVLEEALRRADGHFSIGHGRCGQRGWAAIRTDATALTGYRGTGADGLGRSSLERPGLAVADPIPGPPDQDCWHSYRGDAAPMALTGHGHLRGTDG